MSEWTTKPLSDVVELRRGFDLPHRERKPGDVPVLSSGSTSGWHDVHKVDGPGFVVGRATNLGVPTWCDRAFWPLNTTLYAADFKGNDPRFLYRLFQTLDFTGFDSGSVQPMLNRNYIAKVLVAIPDGCTQCAIADILGALDDKIAANERAIAVVHELAVAAFHSHVRGVRPGDLTFDDVAQIGGGGTPKTSVDEYWDGEFAWATPTDVTELPAPYLTATARNLTEEGLRACSSPLYPRGSVLMTSRATVGAFAIADVPVAVNQGFIVANGREPTDNWWLYHEMKSRVPEFMAYANGATFMELPRGRFKKLHPRWPNESVRRSFNEAASALHGSARAAVLENEALAQTRDELLPLLMSGKITVKSAEKAIGELV